MRTINHLFMVVPDATRPEASEIRNNSKFRGFFGGCIGCWDGTLSAEPSRERRAEGGEPRGPSRERRVEKGRAGGSGRRGLRGPIKIIEGGA